MSTTQKLLHFMRPEPRRLKGIQTEILNPVPCIMCRDGLSLSVQAGWGAYCQPRDSVGDWHAVEAGFPSQVIEDLLPYAEEPDKPTETVYGYVPISFVADIIEQHGGSEQIDAEWEDRAATQSDTPAKLG